MVKIHGKFNRPGAFDFIAGATYVGDSRMLGLAVFLDQTDPSQILLRIKERPVRRVDYREFARLIDFLETFAAGEAYLYSSPDPDPLKASVVLLENNRILLRLEGTSTVLLPVEFFQALNILVAIRKKLEVKTQKEIERKTRLDETSLLVQINNWRGLIVFALLAAVDFSLLVSIFFRPELTLYWLTLTLFLGFWLFVLRPAWSERLTSKVRSYINEDLLNDLSFLHFPRRSVEIFLIILTLVIFYFVFGSDMAHFIMRYYRKSRMP
ncbi:MAG: hypothetical protein CVV42_00540 [Candidatus Riflebacteria bacterium HGW-Riflebacteria-2]|nr:MAG: hypothetical protein CVV42_00540 [Candidatus Riflebacteria bacterium HGW-Riflebacteria-2]